MEHIQVTYNTGCMVARQEVNMALLEVQVIRQLAKATRAASTVAMVRVRALETTTETINSVEGGATTMDISGRQNQVLGSCHLVQGLYAAFQLRLIYETGILTTLCYYYFSLCVIFSANLSHHEAIICSASSRPSSL